MTLVEAYKPNFCSDNKATALHADPEDCSKFYSCFVAITYFLSCPPGLVFNGVYKVCDWPNNVDCGRRKVTGQDSFDLTSTSKPTPSPTSTTLAPSLGVSESSPVPANVKAAEAITPENAVWTLAPPLTTFCEGKLDDLYADPENCSKFYQCIDEVSYQFTCYKDLMYNPLLKNCDWEWNVNCTTQTEDVPDQNQDCANDGQAVTPEVKDSPSASNCGFVVCYVPNWAIYRTGSARFGPENVDPNLCTHIIYAFATIRGNRLAALQPTDEPRGDDIGNYARVTNLKKRKPGLKVLLAVGGWRMDTTLFSNVAATEDSRAEFVSTTIEFLKKRNFDGLDFDWEYPSNGRNPALDKQRYAQLCEELRAAFDREASGERRLILTAAVSANPNIIDASYDIPKLAAALDIVNIMSYDLHGSWEGVTGHHSALKPGPWETGNQTNLNVDWVARYWADLGIPKSKLVVGVPFFARTFTLSSTNNSGIGAPIIGTGLPGKYTKESGSLSYYEVCSILSVSSRFAIDAQRVPYLVSGSQWIGYDDQASLREKVQFIKRNGFGGVMVWDISFDDHTGKFCGEGVYPLLNAVISGCTSVDTANTVTILLP